MRVLTFNRCYDDTKILACIAKDTVRRQRQKSRPCRRSFEGQSNVGRLWRTFGTSCLQMQRVFGRHPRVQDSPRGGEESRRGRVQRFRDQRDQALVG